MAYVFHTFAFLFSAVFGAWGSRLIPKVPLPIRPPQPSPTSGRSAMHMPGAPVAHASPLMTDSAVRQGRGVTGPRVAAGLPVVSASPSDWNRFMETLRGESLAGAYAPTPRSTLTALQANPNSVPTGLVWPSPEAEAKLREEDGIKLYPTHAWTDEMKPIIPASKKLDDTPVIIGVAADSGCGKSTFLRRILGALGTEVKEGHTAIGEMMTVVCLDDYHTNDRAGRKATGLTALDAKENDFALMGAQIQALKEKKAVYKPIYNHDTGNKDPPELLEPNKIMVFEGLHPIYDKKARSELDLAIYIDIVNDVKFAWKVQRDVAERGWTEEQVKEDIEKRLPDFSAYVDPQKADADVVLRYEPSDKGLPFLKVKLIQKKGGAFPMVTLKESVSLTGSKPGAELKMYDDDWFGNAVTVVEMDGEIDMDNMEDQLKTIEASVEGLNAKEGELTDAMVKLKSSPGSQNGTGLLQTIIAMKVREVYEKLTGK